MTALSGRSVIHATDGISFRYIMYHVFLFCFYRRLKLRFAYGSVGLVTVLMDAMAKLFRTCRVFFFVRKVV